MSFDFKLAGGDFSIDPNTGDFVKVEDSEKLVQDLLKIILTPLGSNPVHRFYGSPISSSMIGSPYDFDFTATVASNQLRNAVELLQTLQKEQSKYQKLTAAEQIAAIKNILIERSPTDLRYLKAVVEVFSRALTTVTAEFTITPYI